MRFLKQFLFGFKAYFKAIKFIIEYRYYWFMLIPAALMLVIYKVGELIKDHYVAPKADNMNDIIWYLILVMIEILVALLMMKFAKYLVFMVLSPLLSEISIRTERILTGNKYPFSFKQLINDIRRAMRLLIRNIMWETLFIIIIMIVTYLGWKDPASSPIFYLTYAIGFFYYGFGFMDYILERMRLNMDESIHFARDHRGLAIALGCVYSLMILVPVELGILFHPGDNIPAFLLHLALWLCASAAPILAIVAATIAMNDLVDLKTNIYSQKMDNFEEEED